MSIITERLDGYITSIAEHKDVLTVAQLNTLKELVGYEEDQEVTPVVFEKFDANKLDILFAMVQTIQHKVITNSGDLLESSSARDISSLVGAISALLRAFVSHQKTIDLVKEEADLKFAVIAAIETLESAAQQRFYETLESFA